MYSSELFQRGLFEGFYAVSMEFVAIFIEVFLQGLRRFFWHQPFPSWSPKPEKHKPQTRLGFRSSAVNHLQVNRTCFVADLLLGGSWDLVNKVISTFIGIITLVTQSHDPLSVLRLSTVSRVFWPFPSVANTCRLIP